MKTITNKAQRRLGLPGRPALILNPGESKEITDQDFELITSNRTAARWIERGIIDVGGKVKETKPQEQTREKEVIPEGLTGKGFEILNEGGGWYSAWVNGFKVTDKKVRKADAEALEADYE